MEQDGSSAVAGPGDGRGDDDEMRVLRAIVEATARSTGEQFFESLVRHLALALAVPYAFVAEFIHGGTRLRTLAYFAHGRIIPNVEFDIAGTPCEDVLHDDLCHHPRGVRERFPNEHTRTHGIESYLGVPLRDAAGQALGHLSVQDTAPMSPEPRRLLTFRIFADRAAAELGRLRTERLLRESEERFRDLFDEAPIAYVHEDMETRFLRANRAAMRILGIRPEDVPDCVGKSFVPDTPEAQRRVHEALAIIGRGEGASGVVLELRRRDDGRPIFIQWWSRPDPSGSYTRTMFLDITDRVRMEQEQARLKAQNLYLQEEIKAAHNFEEIIGQGPRLRAVLDAVASVAATDSSVLITGETGTGKELFARALHSASGRRDRPLIKVNCAALPTGLIESELFGHEKGAFTGALCRRIGRFELADGGTLFLDEVGEISLEAQAKLLRVLQEREFERVGSGTPIRVNVRVIAATNRDLLRAVRERTFREDLYYRLNVFPIHLPPLRERREDVPLLVEFLLGKFAARIGRRIESVCPRSLERLGAYAWPGNVRELENVIERAVILSRGPVLEVEPDLLRGGAGGKEEPPEGESLQAIERDHILQVLRRTAWVIDGPAGAARILGLHPNTLRSRMKKLGVTRGGHDIS